MSKKSNFAIGTIVAAGAGYLAGILTAPKSGRETRKDIQANAQKAKSEAERKLKQAQGEMTKLIDEATVEVKKAGDKANVEVKKALETAGKVRQKTRELLSAVHEGEAEDHDLQKAIDEVKQATTHLKKYIEKKKPE